MLFPGSPPLLGNGDTAEVVVGNCEEDGVLASCKELVFVCGSSVCCFKCEMLLISF